MPFTTPPTAVTGAIVQAQHRNILRNNDFWFNALFPAPSAANQVPTLLSAVAATCAKLGTSSFQGGAVTAAKLGTGAITTAKITNVSVALADLSSAAQASLFPSGLILMVRTAAEIPAGWTRETDMNGRLLINAGTTFSVTYGEASDYGTSWSHTHTFSISSAGPSATQANIATISPQQTNAAGDTHTHVLAGTTGTSLTGASAWLLPSRAYVYMRKS